MLTTYPLNSVGSLNRIHLTWFKLLLKKIHTNINTLAIIVWIKKKKIRDKR